jgi:hypothetical protein
MESDVTTTLSELERKLKELERELESVGRGGELDLEPAQAGWTPAPEPPVAPSPPPTGATPLTAVWHGGATPPTGGPPAAPLGAEPVRVAPPPPPQVVVQAHAAPPPPPAPEPVPEPPLHQQLDELIAFRDRLVRTTDELVGELSRVLDELGVAAPPPDPAQVPLSGDVIVEATSSADLATLASLEQSLRTVGGVAHAQVRSLDGGVARIDVRLTAPLPLGAALRAVWPVPFHVTGAGDGRLTIALA